MEVKIGIVNVARELTIEVMDSAEDVQSALDRALEMSSMWTLVDERGRKLVVNPAHIAYVDLGAELSRPVGFGVV